MARQDTLYGVFFVIIKPMRIYVVNKKVGQTPLEALRLFVKAKRLSPADKYCYAGRLDPMAEGVLLILANASQEQREKYQKLPKVYEAEVLFGLGSDTGDLLGMPKRGKMITIDYNKLSSVINKLIPSIVLPVPAYSSVPVKGKPGFFHARAGKKVEMPERKMEVKKVEIISLRLVSSSSLEKRIKSRVGKVKGDFRQEKILKAWGKLLSQSVNIYHVAKIKIHCGSGTYVRSLAEFLGKEIGSSALLYGLKRTKVGKHFV